MLFGRMRPSRVPRSWRITTTAAVGILALGLGLVAVLPATAEEQPLSKDKVATASSVESGAFPAAAAIDGDTSTRWSSQFMDPQWLQVDLGAKTSIGRVVLMWERAHGKAFELQVSDNAATWTTIYATSTSAGGTQDLPVTGSGRYIRLYGTARATGYGYSLWEFQVFGPAGAGTPSTGAGAPTTPAAPPSTTAPAPTGGSGGAGGGAIPSGPEGLISTDRYAQASSIESKGTPAGAVDDNNPATRWSSKFADPQWVSIDLSRPANISKVVLQWESYAKAFQIQVSDDQTTWRTVYTTADGKGGAQTVAVNATGRYVRMYGTQRATPYGYSLWTMDVFGVQAPDNGVGWVPASPVVTRGPSQATPTPTGFHEFQANCSVTRNLPDDPIVFYGLPGGSHMHTFMGNPTTTATSTYASLRAAGSTSCTVPGDKSAYWMPTMYIGDRPIMPVGPQVIYYKSGIIDYPSVQSFPLGLRYVVGSPTNTAKQFLDQSEEGWECGNSAFNATFPACPAGAALNVRFQAPSCWDGKHLDSPDHKSHMAYPVAGRCTAAHPIAVPMLEFKMAFPAGTDTSQVRFSSGASFSFHYDFFEAWDAPILAALVKHCINGGLQCNPRGFDETQPGRGAALTPSGQLP